MKRIFFLLLLVVFVNSLNAKQRCLRYGVIPYTSISDIQTSYKDWKNYLEKKIGRCINISFESNYGSLIQKFGRGEVDFGFVGPFSYILTREIADVEPIVTGVTSDGFATYKSLMVTTLKVANTLGISSPLKGEEGMLILQNKLKNYKKKWMVAFTDESSTSGYAVPNYYMKKSSIDPAKYFKKLTFVGTHDAAQLVVANNIIPIAFGAQMFYVRLLENKKIDKNSNKIIWQSDDIPKSPIIVKKSLSKSLKTKLQTALINIPQKFVPKLAKEIGYIKASHEDYIIIEKINQYLKKGG